MRKSQASINQWIREQEARLGINDKIVVNSNAVTGAALPTVTVYPGPLVIERLAHYWADKKIAVDQGYDAMCSRTDAMLAEFMVGNVGLVDPDGELLAHGFLERLPLGMESVELD
jgi:hypothetical protein